MNTLRMLLLFLLSKLKKCIAIMKRLKLEPGAGKLD